ncbi:hypothetical protein D0S45_17595 [Marinifilum sp. JC120]|nr:hypothetical protein D0S45_17595 [Marinifilum sp. JC120]
MAKERLPILGKAEILSQEAPYGGSFPGEREEVWTFEEAQQRLAPQLEQTIEEAQNIPREKRLRSGVYFAVDLDCNSLAKSYYPKAYFEKAGWELTGSIKTIQKKRDKTKLKQAKQARRLFFKASTRDLEQAHAALINKSYSTKEELNGPVRINQIQMVLPEKKMIGLDHPDASELLELIVHPMLETDWQEFQHILFDIVDHKNYPRILFNWVLGGRANMPRFVPVQAMSELYNELASLNPVRALRPMPGISYPRMTTDKKVMADPPPIPDPMRSGPLPSVGVFDGGVDTTIPHLGRWTIPVDLTSAPPEESTFAHGTAVCGAVLYGQSPNIKCEEPSFTVKSFRVLPEPNDTGVPGLGLYQIIKMIEETVKSPDNSSIKTYVLSFGPNKPIEDDEIDPFTATLDRLAYEEDVLFIVAVGNEGQLSEPYNRIQPPADAVNGLGVGAYIYDGKGKPIRAPYSCSGPGRSGNAVKPDIHMFGGWSDQPFCVFKPGGDGECTYSMGTSFSAPLACGVAGNLLYRAEHPETMTPQTAKALMIHKAFQDGWEPEYGWGPLSCNLDDLMTCSKNFVTLLYNGKLRLGKRTHLRIPFFNDLAEKGQARFTWTLVYATDVAPSMPDEYTLGGTQVTFRPHSDIYTYEYQDKTKTINKADHPDEFARLISKGIIKQSKLPKTDSSIGSKHSLFLTEEQRRNIGVWDTTKHYWTKMKFFKSLKNPVIDIHAQVRSDWYYNEKIRPPHLTYACVLSIELKKDLNLYQMIRERIPELIEVRLRSRAQVRI